MLRPYPLAVAHASEDYDAEARSSDQPSGSLLPASSLLPVSSSLQEHFERTETIGRGVEVLRRLDDQKRRYEGEEPEQPRTRSRSRSKGTTDVGLIAAIRNTEIEIAERDATAGSG